MNKTEAISQFLKENSKLAFLYSPEMEVQVNVVPGPERVPQGKGFYYTDPDDSSGESWAPFRIPYNAGSEPEFRDHPLSFGTDKFEGIGLTGWNWAKKQSQWVGFDFDSIANHSGGLPESELDEIRILVSDIPWVTTRKSTSGLGLHLYVHFADPPETQNHAEHAALARSVLGFISAQIGIRLDCKVDTVGQILWVWHRRQSSDCYEVVKQGSVLEVIPHNWRDHIEVVSKRSLWASHRCDKQLDDLVVKTSFSLLNERHRALIDWFIQHHHEKMWSWDADRNMLLCHTSALKQAHTELGLKGPFETLAKGQVAGDQNCFLFPQADGWVVRRHTRGTTEHQLWSTDPSGWTRCDFDTHCSLDTAARLCGGSETEKNAFVFRSLSDARNCLKELDILLDVPHELMDRQTLISEKNDGRVVVSVPRLKRDDSWIPGWAPEAKFWQRVFHRELKPLVEQCQTDEIIRHLIRNKSEIGWAVKIGDQWFFHPLDTVRTYLRGIYRSEEIKQILSSAIAVPWELVIYPFETEYPGGRRWNIKRPQYAIDPDPGECPTWDLVLNHIGTGLNEVIQDDKWCNENNVRSGGDYLRMWLAWALRRPTCRLPYLFLYSQQQNTGKSVLHEMVAAHIFRNGVGVQRADASLKDRFNAELAGAIICVVEETSLKKYSDAYNKIKDYVTSPTITIHGKGMTPYDTENLTHWIHCGNSLEECPIVSGDTRITLLKVNPVENEIPKPILSAKMKAEAPQFLWKLLSIDLPPHAGRLSIPVIDSYEKIEQMTTSRSEIESFIHDKMYQVNGTMTPVKDFHERFATEFVAAANQKFWTIQRVSRNMPDWLERGRSRKDTMYYIINWTFNQLAEEKTRLCVRKGWICDIYEARRADYAAIEERQESTRASDGEDEQPEAEAGERVPPNEFWGGEIPGLGLIKS